MAEKVASAGKKTSQRDPTPQPGTADIEAIVRKIVADILEVEPHTIDPNAQLVEDLGMDSMMALEILAAIEKRFRIKVPEENLPKLTTLNHIIQVAKRYAHA